MAVDMIYALFFKLMFFAKNDKKTCLLIVSLHGFNGV